MLPLGLHGFSPRGCHVSGPDTKERHWNFTHTHHIRVRKAQSFFFQIFHFWKARVFLHQERVQGKAALAFLSAFNTAQKRDFYSRPYIFISPQHGASTCLAHLCLFKNRLWHASYNPSVSISSLGGLVTWIESLSSLKIPSTSWALHF